MKRIALLFCVLIFPSISYAGWWTNGTQGVGGSGITDVVQDTTPTLGGALDANSKAVTAVASIDVTGAVTAGSVTTATLGAGAGAGTDDDHGVTFAKVTGTPTTPAANTMKLVDDDDVPAIVDPAGGIAQVATSTGSANFGISYWMISSGDGSCAAAGTVDLTPDCGQEVCSNNLKTCQDVIEYATLVTPTDTTCTALIVVTAKAWVMCK